MGRKRFARRFEPRYGVSQQMLEAESDYVQREVDDYLLCSISDLQQQLQERQDAWVQKDEMLRQRLERLPERRHLALQCMIVRDLDHLYALYLTYLHKYAEDPAAAVPRPVVNEGCILPFSEWLFGS